MTDIVIKDLCKSYGGVPVLLNLNLVLKAGVFNSLMGRSGGGKTTLLRILAGLEKADSGEIYCLSHNPDAAAQKNAAGGAKLRVRQHKTALRCTPDGFQTPYVFQNDLLIETISALGNVNLSLKKNSSVAKTTESRLNQVGLHGAEIRRDVSELSGGMRRRVSIVRACAYLESLSDENKILLLDEPFKGLDETTKLDVMNFVKNESNGCTALLVTHDASEARFFSEEIIKLC